jgi:hypothetical protein
MTTVGVGWAKPVQLHRACASHPEEGSHELMVGEMRCAYCGVKVIVTCNGCNKFLSRGEVDRNESRCDDCM